MLDILDDLDESKGGPYQVGAISINDASTVLRGAPGRSPNPIIMGSNGPMKFDPNPSDTNLFPFIQALNNEHSLESNYFGETWSSYLIRGISENDLLEKSGLF